jgi:hypothetical protein
MMDTLTSKTLILVIVGETGPLADLAQRLLSINMPAGYDPLHHIVANMDEDDILRTMNKIMSVKSKMPAGQLYTLVVVMLVELAGTSTISPRADDWVRAWPRKFLWYWRPHGAPPITTFIPVNSAVIDPQWCVVHMKGGAWEMLKRQAQISCASRMWDSDGLRYLSDTSSW